jgi:3-deoxy-D-manno-octulosonate 8-phosphate phosphatase (KDO 8-P phosphatase)
MKLLISEAEFEARLKKIKLLLLDVDGILTNGNLFWMEGQGFTRTYNIYDGYGIKMIQKMGIEVGIISGGASTCLKERIKLLEIRHAVLGSEDKLASMNQILAESGLTAEQACFMGDEWFDIPALRKVGLAVTVPEAMVEVHEVVHAVTRKSGGHGAVREVIDRIRHAQGLSFPG